MPAPDAKLTRFTTFARRLPGLGAFVLMAALVGPVSAQNAPAPAPARAPDSTISKHAPAVARPSAELSRPSPNPARGRIELRYTTPRAGVIDLAIYDFAGRLVRVLIHGSHPAGPGEAVWDGRDTTGAHVTNGLYFARLASPGSLPRVQKIALVR